MSSLQPNTVSAVDTVRNTLEQEILSLHFAPGAKITESDLAVRYGISRNTIREAIAHLLAQGLLTKIANKGVYVRKFTTEDVQEIFHLRALLEIEAATQIIAAGTSLSYLDGVIADLETYNQQCSWDDYVRTDIAFHRELVSAAKSPRLTKLYDTILTEVKLCIYQTRNYVTHSQENSVSHRVLLDAINSGDLESSVSLLNEHIEHVIKRYCAGLIVMSYYQG